LSGVPNRVGVSSGAEKPRTNIGAARSSLLNVLITDEETAGKMLDILDEEELLSADPGWRAQEQALQGDRFRGCRSLRNRL
jgi:hypothetical protein